MKFVMFFDKLTDMIEDLFAYLEPLSEYARRSDKYDFVRKVSMDESNYEVSVKFKQDRIWSIWRFPRFQSRSAPVVRQKRRKASISVLRTILEISEWLTLA